MIPKAMQRRDFLSSLALGSPLSVAWAREAEAPMPLRIATFQADVTPPPGSPLCLGFIRPAERIVDRLSARGMILFAGGPPIVLCAVDWVLIANGAHDAWCKGLAEAVGTTIDRVSVHTVHQHDAPAVDDSAEEILAANGLGGKMYNVAAAKEALERVAGAAGEAAGQPRHVTHLGYGLGKVEEVASTRRVLTPDGKLAFWRSSTGTGPRNKQGSAAPEGLIDPHVRLVSFWDGQEPLVAMSYYAYHPCSYYGRGGVTADFVGMARAAREAALPGTAQIYFDGAGGDVACGKYNDGSPRMRPILAARLEQGMKLAWETQEKVPVTAADVSWRTHPVALPIRKSITEESCLQTLNDADGAFVAGVRAALDLAWLRRVQSGHRLAMNCLRVGPAHLLHMQGELFVTYQLAAQQMRANGFVCLAAYGDLAPGYVGAKIAYSRGGYETGCMSRVAPEVENVLMTAMRCLLDVEERKTRALSVSSIPCSTITEEGTLK